MIRSLRSACLLAALVVACGYTFGAGPGIARIAGSQPVDVAPFDNNSKEADAAIAAARAAARVLAERGVSMGDGPQALVLKGSIDSIGAVPLGPGAWRVDGRLRLTLVDPKQANKVIAKSVVVDAEGFVSGDDVEGSDTSRRVATLRLLDRMTTNAVDRLSP